MKKGFNLRIGGFTFIEMIIVIAIVSFALPTVYSILFIILQQQSRIIKLNQVRKEGTYVANTLTTLVRNYAYGIYSAQDDTTAICSPTSAVKSFPTLPDTSIPWFKDRFGNWFTFSLSGNNLASASPNIADAGGNLNSTKVIISNFSAKCTVTDFASPLVIFNFDICYDSSSGGSPTCGALSDTISFHYQPSIKLRNY